MNISNFAISSIRTYVPIFVGLGLTWLASTFNIIIDENSKAGLVALLTAVLTALYWLIARILEKWNPKFGGLLGVPAQPHYVAESPTKNAVSAIPLDDLPNTLEEPHGQHEAEEPIDGSASPHG